MAGVRYAIQSPLHKIDMQYPEMYTWTKERLFLPLAKTIFI